MGDSADGALFRNLRARFPRLHGDVIRFELERCNGHAGHAAHALRALDSGHTVPVRSPAPPRPPLSTAEPVGGEVTLRSPSTAEAPLLSTFAEPRALAEWAELRAAETQVALLDAQLELRLLASKQSAEATDLRKEAAAAMAAEEEARTEMASLRDALEQALASPFVGSEGTQGRPAARNGGGWARIHALQTLRDAAARLDVGALRTAIDEGEAAGVEAGALDGAHAIMAAKAAENLELYQAAALAGQGTWDPLLERAIEEGRAAGLPREDLLKAARVLVTAAARTSNLELLEAAIHHGKAIGLMRSELEAVIGRSCEALEYSVLQWKAAKYTSCDSVWRALEGGDTVLIRGSWLMACWRSARLLPRRQELPPEAVWDVGELMAAPPGMDGIAVPILAISHCWETSDHPDPQGGQLQILGRILEQRLASRDHEAVRDLAVFFDWCSLPQPPWASKEEEAAFHRALRHSDLWFARSRSSVWWLTSTPDGVLPASRRGWPCFEQALSRGVAAGRGVLDLGALDGSCTDFSRTSEVCGRTRGPPMLPEVFARALRTKSCARRADAPLLEAKYRQAFEDAVVPAAELGLHGLGWGAEQARGLAAVLHRCTALQSLRLQQNMLGDAGAWELSGAVSWCSNLRELDLSANGIGNAGATCGCLSSLLLRKNRIEDPGAEALAAAVPWCVRLGSLDLRSNRFGEEGLRRLEAAWGETRPAAGQGARGGEAGEGPPPGRGLWV
uniref:Uncharacterized protein n=1 Tax=Alexandrium monilatum TaxID=311494 RepID=A0A7S4Q2M2_9DINO